MPSSSLRLRAKFEQHPDLARNLVATGDARLVEESNMDAFWGIGKKGIGQNMLGVLLMEVRSSLQQATRADKVSGAV